MRRQRGFTLLEVVVALAVIAIAMSAAMRGVTRYVDNSVYLKEKTLAHWVGMNKIAEFQALGKWTGVSTQSGTETLAGRDWYWTVTVSETEDENLRRLDVTVAPDTQHDSVLVSLMGTLGRPS